MIGAGKHPVEHARGESVSGANTIDDPGNEHFFGPESVRARVDARGDAVPVAIVDMTRGRGDQLKVRKGAECGFGGFAAAAFALAAEFAAEQKRDVAMV